LAMSCVMCSRTVRTWSPLFLVLSRFGAICVGGVICEFCACLQYLCVGFCFAWCHSNDVCACRSAVLGCSLWPIFESFFSNRDMVTLLRRIKILVVGEPNGYSKVNEYIVFLV
jgi:hypothetical protein